MEPVLDIWMNAFLEVHWSIKTRLTPELVGKLCARQCCILYFIYFDFVVHVYFRTSPFLGKDLAQDNVEGEEGVAAIPEDETRDRCRRKTRKLSRLQWVYTASNSSVQ